MRARFISAWNGIATIIFFAGIFLRFEVSGFSGMLIGFFMWIVGGYIANVLFGPKKKDPRTDFSPRRRQRNSSIIGGINNTINKPEEFCIACGHRILDGEVYCSNCGTAVSNFVNK